MTRVNFIDMCNHLNANGWFRANTKPPIRYKHIYSDAYLPVDDAYAAQLKIEAGELISTPCGGAFCKSKVLRSPDRIPGICDYCNAKIKHKKQANRPGGSDVRISGHVEKAIKEKAKLEGISASRLVNKMLAGLMNLPEVTF